MRLAGSSAVAALLLFGCSEHSVLPTASSEDERTLELGALRAEPQAEIRNPERRVEERIPPRR